MKDKYGTPIGHQWIGMGKRSCPQEHLKWAEDCWATYSWSYTHDKCGYCAGAIPKRRTEKHIGA